MSNSDRLVLALGGAGTVGSGIVKALLDKGETSDPEAAERQSSDQSQEELLDLRLKRLLFMYLFI